MYIKKSRMTLSQQSELIKLFVAVATSESSCRIGCGSIQYSNLVIQKGLRRLIANKQPCFELFAEVEADESCFGGKDKA